MKRKLIVAILLTVTTVFTFWGVTQVQAAKTLRIGVLCSFSGFMAMWEIPLVRGYELMADKINREGGIKIGKETYQIELINADYKSNPEVGVAQANRLIFNEKINFIMGAGFSACSLAIQPITEKNKVILISWGYSPKILGADKPYTFRLYASGSEVVKGILIYLDTHRPDIKTIAQIAPNDESGWGNSKDCKAYASGLGLEVVTEVFYQRGTTDFFPILTKMLLKKPQVIIPLTMPPGDTALLMQQAHQLGYKGFVAAPNTSDPKLLVAKAGEAAEGYIWPSKDFTGSMSTPKTREFYKNYIEKYNEEFNYVAIPGYAAPWVLKMAIEKAGTLDTTAVAKTMENVEGEYPWGYFTMGGLKSYGAKHQIAEPIWLMTIRKGEPLSLGYVTVPVP